jgi:hypothetical protein
MAERRKQRYITLSEATKGEHDAERLLSDRSKLMVIQMFAPDAPIIQDL